MAKKQEQKDVNMAKKLAMAVYRIQPTPENQAQLNEALNIAKEITPLTQRIYTYESSDQKSGLDVKELEAVLLWLKRNFTGVYGMQIIPSGSYIQLAFIGAELDNELLDGFDFQDSDVVV